MKWAKKRKGCGGKKMVQKMDVKVGKTRILNVGRSPRWGSCTYPFDVTAPVGLMNCLLKPGWRMVKNKKQQALSNSLNFLMMRLEEVILGDNDPNKTCYCDKLLNRPWVSS